MGILLLVSLSISCSKDNDLIEQANQTSAKLADPTIAVSNCEWSFLYHDVNFYPYGNLMPLHEKLNDYFSNRYFDNCKSLPPNEYYLCETTTYYGQTFSESWVNYDVFTNVVSGSNVQYLKNIILADANANKPTSAHKIVNVAVNWNEIFCCNPSSCSSSCYARWLDYTVTYAKLCPCGNLC